MNFALSFRPKNFDEILGQYELIELFKKFNLAQKLPHSIFFGQTACGKTTFARVVAKEFKLDFYEFDGGNFKLEEVRKVLDNYKNSLYKPLIFIDEIHRLSRVQQEMLLIPMENYRLILIGASTQNPYFVLSLGIRSRCMLFEFKALGIKELQILLLRVKAKIDFDIDEDAKEFLLKSSDARMMLNLLEFALVLDQKHITLANLKKLYHKVSTQALSLKDRHYILISALIKSLRGSDVDASIYYLASLIDGGESAEFIARRLVIFASEDIANADPNALNLAVSTLQAVKNIGYPEARIILAQCVIYLASAIKSNASYKAIDEALAYVRDHKDLLVPHHLKHEGREDYLYPHDFNGWVKQKYLSKDLKFYHSKGLGEELTLLNNLNKLKNHGI